MNFMCQFLWLAYAVITQQWGFIVAACLYMVVFGRNAVKWTEIMYKNKTIMKERIRKASEPVGVVRQIEFVDEGVVVNGHFTDVPRGHVVYEDENGVIGVGATVPPGHKRIGLFYQH